MTCTASFVGVNCQDHEHARHPEAQHRGYFYTEGGVRMDITWRATLPGT